MIRSCLSHGPHSQTTTATSRAPSRSRLQQSQAKPVSGLRIHQGVTRVIFLTQGNGIPSGDGLGIREQWEWCGISGVKEGLLLLSRTTATFPS